MNGSTGARWASSGRARRSSDDCQRLLWAYDISTPFPLVGCMIPPWLFGVRAILSVVLFGICAYVAYFRAPARA